MGLELLTDVKGNSYEVGVSFEQATHVYNSKLEQFEKIFSTELENDDWRVETGPDVWYEQSDRPIFAKYIGKK
jgi:hypothetical protein